MNRFNTNGVTSPPRYTAVQGREEVDLEEEEHSLEEDIQLDEIEMETDDDHSHSHENDENDSSSSIEKAQGEQEAGQDRESGVKIRVLDLNGKVYFIHCQVQDRVAQLKEKVRDVSSVRVELQRLIYRGQVLSDEKTVEEYKLEHEQTIHLFARQEPSSSNPEPSSVRGSSSHENNNDHPHHPWQSAEVFNRSNDRPNYNPESFSAAVFPSDGRPRLDPVMIDAPIGICARRVKLWSSFIAIIYTMRFLSQFALLANVDENPHSSNYPNSSSGGETPRHRRRYYSPYRDQDPLVSITEMSIHAFGVYVGILGINAAHDTDVRKVRLYCRTIVWLAILTVLDQVYLTLQISHSDFPEIADPVHRIPSRQDILMANVLQTGILILMWAIAVNHAILHKIQVLMYNETLPVAIVQPTPAVESESGEATAAEEPPTDSSPRQEEASVTVV